MEYNRLTSRTLPRPKKYNSERKADAAVNLLTTEALPQFTPIIAPREVPLFEGEERNVRVGRNLHAEEVQLLTLLREWADVFAWDVNDLVGVSPMIICHSLNANPEFKPVCQARRYKSEEQWAAAAEEVDKLLASGYVEKAVCPKWVSNVVMVRKANGKWRMCIDYTNLNHACPKDAFPLPKIDRLVDSCTGQSHMSFMDAYSGYHQIRMNPRDK